MNNAGFNDFIKIAGLIVPIITALISFAGIVAKPDSNVENLQNLFSSSKGTEAGGSSFGSSENN
ncbi:hypothetical protein [Corynebacterium ulceribovis]|uniref:hypothetical protein n=1 Tax=Corynebacterium ulceribovis TaxID=487732 RepID=UPI0003628405|nr:hypothetical protein [Corynebacterium ulceribovis]